MLISSNEKTYALITNPASKKLASALEANGANVIWFPQIQTKRLVLDEKSNALLSRLTDFDWLIFQDIFAVDYFLQTLEEYETDFFELDALKVCALGEAVSDRLRFAQLHADVIPNFVETDAVFSSLSDYAGEKNIGGKSFLLIKKLSAERELKNKLSEVSAIVSELEIYCAEVSESGANARLKALLKGGAIDKFIFTSTADLLALKELAGNDLPAKILIETKIFATDEVTLQSLKEHNLKARLFSTEI